MTVQKIKNISRTWVLFLGVTMAVYSCDKQPIYPTDPDPELPSNPADYTSIADFRALYTVGTPDFTIPAGTKKIKGVVISNSANEAAGNYRIQDESGVGLYFYSMNGSPVYTQGSILEIDAAGEGVFTTWNGDAELKNVPVAKVKVLSGNMTIEPRGATAKQIVDNRAAWASSLVKINNIESITASTTNSAGANFIVKDASGELTLFVRTTSGITVNTAAKSITGYVSLFNDVTQIAIRTAADLQP